MERFRGQESPKKKGEFEGKFITKDGHGKTGFSDRNPHVFPEMLRKLIQQVERAVRAT